MTNRTLREVCSRQAMAHSGRFAASPRAATITAAMLFAYVLWFRTHDITQSFYLGGDQMRDWQVALRPLTGLPLSGVSSTAGGNTIGPIYYWILWCIARFVGPFVDYLPHAGGIGIALLQSAADALLFLALCRRLQSLATALVAVLLVATSGYDATLSSTIWNPPVAVALVKLALAALLWNVGLTWARVVIATGAGWLAVQCHTSAIVVALPLILWVMVEPLRARNWRGTLERTALILGLVVFLQVPWIVHTISYGGQEPGGIAESLGAVMASPRDTVRLSEAARLTGRSLGFILLAPLAVQWFGVVLAAAAIPLVFLSRDPSLIVASVAPLATSIAMFALWQGRLDQAYWFLVLSPSAAIVLVGWADRASSRAWVVSIALLVALAVLQPARARMAWTFHRMPGYGALVAGCRTLAAEKRVVRDVKLTFRISPTPDPLWVYSILGGTVAETAPIAVIDARGLVRFE